MGDLLTSAAAAIEQSSISNDVSVTGNPPDMSEDQVVTIDQEAPPPSNHGQLQTHPPFASQLDMTASPQPGNPGHPGAYNMASMADALPPVQYRIGQYHHGNNQRYNPTTSSPMMQQMQQMSPYGPSPGMNMAAQAYYVQQQPQMPPFYGGNQLSPAQPHSSMLPRQNIAYYPNQILMNQPAQGYYYPQPSQYGSQNQGMPTAMMLGQYMTNGPTTTVDHRFVAHNSDGALQYQANKQVQDSVDRRQNTVRGPPRKPRQSGHAIWIGNLPPQTELMSLVHHVCKEAPGLESLFLISKSNCAFANFKDEQTCLGAQQKLHDSKFQSVRLVSRLRKSTVEGVSGTTAPTGPSSASTSLPVPNEENSTEIGGLSPTTGQTVQAKDNSATDGTTQLDKFFILKSLTVEDLELSVKTGVWATQSHNEETLNAAFKDADNVYLVFSANKSGEYFGYARMLSQIDDDPAAAVEFAPKAQATSDTDLPKAIPTEATEHAPKGRIIDDSARGTIFWEVDRDDDGSSTDNESETGSTKNDEDEEAKTWGKPFKLEWLSTARLPFYRTRGLRNPWNSNREVKIARDGTELEPSVGRRLIGLFNRIQSQTQFAPPIRPPVGMVPGYPHMRPYGQ